MMKRNNQGFTLVELLVATLIGTLVMAAATTVILLGIRINHKANDTAKNQFTTRTLMTLLEDLSGEGKITHVITTTEGWEIKVSDGTPDGRVALAYDTATQAIYTGDKTTGTPVMQGVYASYVTLDKTNKLLTFSMESVQGIFASTLNCRVVSWMPNTSTDVTAPSIDADTETKRKDFLNKLTSQYKAESINKGQIISTDPAENGKYYTQWYIGDEEWNRPGTEWGPDTPWCVCYLSWGLAEVGMKGGRNDRWYADVDEFMATFTGENWLAAGGTPTPGDLIFFDWIVNGDSDPQHIGAVLKVEDGSVYTIEGNSAGIIAIRKYALDDPHILGYGILNWN